jgi:DNA-binding IclR family transcriptional regulator
MKVPAHEPHATIYRQRRSSVKEAFHWAERNGRRMPVDGSVFGRILQVIEAFGSDDVTLSLSELATRAGLPKSTVHRIARTLVGRGWLERSDERYALGIRLFELGQRVQLQRFDLHEIAIPFMEDLYEATHEIVNLGVLDGSDVVYLAKIGGHRRVPIPTRLGGRLPAHCTALGKAMLAFSSTGVRRDLQSAQLVARTQHSITDPTVLEDELVRIERDRTAVDREELIAGVVCVAAPVFRDDVAVAAVSVTGPKARIDPLRIAPAVQTAARGISRRLSRSR